MGFIIYIALFTIIIIIMIHNLIYKKSFFIKKHFLFLLILFEYFIFTFFSPLYGYINDIDTVFGNNIKEYYDDIMIIYSIAIFSFFIGYMSFIGKKKFKMSKGIPLIISKNYIRFFFIIALVAVLLWSKLTSFGLVNILLMEQANIDRFTGGYNYLIFMMEFSIGAMAMAIFSNMKSRELFLWTLLFGFIFLIFGFRYRLIMLILVLLSGYIVKNNFNRKSIKNFILIAIAALFIFSLFSNLKNVGRNLGRESSVDTQIASVEDFGSLLHKNTINYLYFMSLYKSLENGQSNYDYGETMFIHIFYRAIPASFFENNTKPPAPALEDLSNSFGSIQGYYAGSAITNIGHFYYSFSILGVIFGMLALGTLIAYITNSYLYTQDIFSIFIYIITITISFHFVSRGYMPQIVNDLIFIIFPMLVLVVKNKFRLKKSFHV